MALDWKSMEAIQQNARLGLVSLAIGGCYSASHLRVLAIATDYLENYGAIGSKRSGMGNSDIAPLGLPQTVRRYLTHSLFRKIVMTLACLPVWEA